MKAVIFQDVNPLFPIENFKDHYVLMFDLTLKQHATENCHYRELVGKPLRPEHFFNFPLEHVTKPIVFPQRNSTLAVDKLGIVG